MENIQTHRIASSFAADADLIREDAVPTSPLEQIQALLPQLASPEMLQVNTDMQAILKQRYDESLLVYKMLKKRDRKEEGE